MNFSFPKNNPATPVIFWKDKPQISFSVPEAELIPTHFIDSKKILSNLRQIRAKEKMTEEITSTNYIKYLKEEEEQIWHNRIIHGDSLIGMNALLSEGLKSKIQMIYIDPPFGINFDAKHSSGSQQSEGYLDTWENGLGSYLEYLRERFVLFRALLTQTGSIFVQIGERNLHYVRCLLDEIFGRENCISQITFRTAISTNKVQGIADYLLWYARDKKHVFRRNLFTERPLDKIKKTFTYSTIDSKSGKEIKFKPQELVKRTNPLKPSRFERQYFIEFQDLKIKPPKGFEWRWEKNALQKLISLNRVHVINKKLYGKRYESDFPAMILTNVWTDTSTSTFAAKKHYTVHTNPKVIQRCIAMTTRPGDLVLDPTSGSGTTAVVAEKLERKWIVFDTSPSAVLSTCNWLLGTLFPSYKWNIEENEFEYSPVKKISISDLAHDRKSKHQVRFEIPIAEKQKKRIASPFTLEKVSCETLQEWNKKIYDILSDNGLFLPTGTTVKITDLTELPVLKNRIQTIDGDHPNIPKDVVFFQGRINNKSHYLFVGPPSRELVSKDFVQFLKEYFDQALNSEDIILITSSYSSKFLHRLQNLQKEFTSQKKNSNHPRLIFASLHPDLMVMGLDFKFHRESIKIVGNLHLNVEETQFNFSFYNFQTEKEQQIDFTKIALWGLRPLKLKAPEVSFNQQRLEWMQLPFYSQYIHSQLKLDFCRGDNQKSIIERLKTRSTNVDLWEFCGYDFYGTQHYGFFSF